MQSPKIIETAARKLIGLSCHMSFTQNRTVELWKTFGPRRKEIKAVSSDLFSVEVYDENFFTQFNPENQFEKWAAVEVDGFDSVPEGMETLIIPSGLYAVFLYQGKGSEVQSFYQSIFQKWLPQSGYQLDNRPHMAIMGKDYKNEHPDSEEEIWIPIRKA